MSKDTDALGEVLSRLALDSFPAPSSTAPLSASASAKPRPPVCLVFQALPLTGKSSLCRGLFDLLIASGCTPRWLNQDECPEPRRKSFLAYLASALADSRVTHVLIDKTNLDPKNVADYVPLCVPAATIHIRHPNDAPGSVRSLIAIARQRFDVRGGAHRSLKPDVGSKEPSIDAVLGFFREAPLTASACGGLRPGEVFGVLRGGMVNLSALDAPEAALAALWAALADRGLVPSRWLPTVAPAHRAAFAKAVTGARAYELLLGSPRPPPPAAATRYIGVALGEDARTALLERVPKIVLHGLTQLPAVHLTVVYTGGTPDHLAELIFGERLAASAAVELTATGLAYDGRCLCAVCPAGLGGAGRGGVRNLHPHITLATAPGASTAESNELLRRLHTGDASVSSTVFAQPLMLHGVLRRFAPSES